MPVEARNEVADDANWRVRVRLEETCSKVFGDEYGYLCTLSESSSPQRVHATALAKYAGTGGIESMLIKRKRVPLSPKDLAEAVEDEVPPESPTGITALGSVRLNHTRRLEAIQNTPQELETTTRKHHCAKQTLEQFGICQFGIKETRSKLPTN